MESIPNVKLVLGGRLAKHYDPVKVAEDLGVLDYVDFVGWIDINSLPSFIAASDVCFFTPPADRAEINKTIATKIFQYAIMGKPIITSDAKMMKEFVVNNEMGISVQSHDSDGFADAVLKIYNKEFVISNTKKPDDWYWEETIQPLLSHYLKLGK